MNKYLITFISFMFVINSFSQVRDTLKLSISKVDKKPSDTIFVFSSRIDTIALQPLKTDTSKIVKDINPQDMTESKYLVKLMGSVRVNSYYDYIGMTSTEGFLPYDIPVGVKAINGSSVYVGARQSRIGLEGTANTSVGKLKTYIEVDFVSSTSSFLRLRQAYAEWDFLKVGYTWTTFMDNTSLPNTVDFEGPNSALSKRRGLIRYERKVYNSSSVGVSFEAPQKDYSNPADSLLNGRNIQGNFDIAGRYKQANKWGHVQLAGIFRRIAYVNKTEIDNLFGWGILLSSIVKFNQNHSLFAQYSIGEGIANYYGGFTDRELDAIYNPNQQNMTLKNIRGGYLTYSYSMNQKWYYSLTFGVSYLKNKDFESAEAFYSSRYFAGNVFYSPIETINIGAEFTTGSRTNNDFSEGSATRISTIFIFNF